MYYYVFILCTTNNNDNNIVTYNVFSSTLHTHTVWFSNKIMVKTHSLTWWLRTKILPVLATWYILQYMCQVCSFEWSIVLWFSLVGPSVTKHHLPQMLALWANAFPKTVKEFEQEKNRGDAYTWHVTLECRAGALCCKYTHDCVFLSTRD